MNKTLLILLLLTISTKLISQIHYVDLIPDIVINNTTDTIDINSDGIDDLIFTQESNIPSQEAHGVGVTLLHYDIEFVGNPPPYDPTHFYAYKLDSNILVDINADNKSWIVKLGPNDAVRVMYMFFYNVPYHLGEWINGVVNGYLGIRIKINNQWHYGWVRMDVPINAQELTIKDYAYNLTAEQGIYTGQENSYIHNPILVNYDANQCGNILTYQRDSFTHLAYDKIYRVNSNGLCDSIGFVDVNSPPYFIHSDSNLILETQYYQISAVDSAQIEWGKSDSINSIYASITNINNNYTLNWSAFNNLNFSQYIIYRTDTLCEKFIAIDSVPSNIISYNINSSFIDSSCNEYQIGIALTNAINIPGLGLIDTIKSNVAVKDISYQLNPIAGFKSQIISSGFVDKIQFYDTSRSDIKQWYWDFGDGSTSNLRNPQHDFLTGTYTISLKVSNCFGQDSISIQDYIDVISVVNVNRYDNSIKLYPNPARHRVNIKAIAGNTINRIRILTIEAKEVYSTQNINNFIYNINLLGLEAGFYFVEVQFTDGTKEINKLIVEDN